MNEEKLIGYIKGEIFSESETINILKWIESSTENQKKYNQLKNLWVLTGLDRPGEVAIPAFTYPKEKNLFSQKWIFGQYMKYAAIFIFAFAMGTLSLYFINKNQESKLCSLYNTIVVPNGERSQILLYDGTKVWLNSGTKLRYPVAFSSKTREVFIEGEAFFDVAKDKEHPFVVNTDKLSIKVLGTHFDVCAYSDDDKTFTTLEEGSVKVTNKSNGKELRLKPGEQVVLDRETNVLSQQNVNTDLYTSWKENLLKFENAPFEDVIKKMERWYDIKIIVDPSINTMERYTMTIKTESLREMLALLSKTTRIDYEIKVNSVFIKKKTLQ